MGGSVQTLEPWVFLTTPAFLSPGNPGAPPELGGGVGRGGAEGILEGVGAELEHMQRG